MVEFAEMVIVVKQEWGEVERRIVKWGTSGTCSEEVVKYRVW